MPSDEVLESRAIEAAGADNEVDEFAPEELDANSLAESASLTSSIYQHSYQHGRRFHKYRSGRYPIPNDDEEQGRDYMKHAMMLELLDGKLFFAQIGDHPQKIIDLGTGTGIWAIEVGEKYPSAEVIGVDLSPIQPIWVPPNVRFLVDDIEDEWLNGSNFDLVHIRHVCPFLKDMLKLLQQSYQHLRPGGWIEIQELGCTVYCDDNTMPADYPVAKFLALSNEIFCKNGHAGNLQVAPKIGTVLQSAGCSNITCKAFKVPLRAWAKNPTLRLVGLYFQLVMEMALPLLTVDFNRPAGWSAAEAELFVASCRTWMRDTSVHSYVHYYFWQAQKPEGAAIDGQLTGRPSSKD